MNIMNVTSSIRQGAAALYNNSKVQEGVGIAFTQVSRVPIVGPLAVGGSLTLLGISRIWQESRLTSDQEKSYARPIAITLAGAAIVAVSVLSISGLFSRTVEVPVVQNSTEEVVKKALDLDPETHCFIAANHTLTLEAVDEPIKEVILPKLAEAVHIPDAATHCFLENRTFEIEKSMGITPVVVKNVLEPIPQIVKVVPELPEVPNSLFGWAKRFITG